MISAARDASLCSWLLRSSRARISWRASRIAVRRVSSQSTTSAARSSSSTRRVTSSRFPIGVAQTASGTGHRSPSSASKPTKRGADEAGIVAEHRRHDPNALVGRVDRFRRAVFSAALEEMSPAAAPKPPPTMKISGSKRFTSEPSAIPRKCPSARPQRSPADPPPCRADEEMGVRVGPVELPRLHGRPRPRAEPTRDGLARDRCLGRARRRRRRRDGRARPTRDRAGRRGRSRRRRRCRA